MTEVGVHEAKTHLSRLLRRVAAGEQIIITSGGRPAARFVPFERGQPRELGFDAGLITIPEDFDDPSPTHSHALQIVTLPRHHRDPFDRLPIAQAQLEGIPLVTVDRALEDYDVETIRADRGARGDVDI